MRHILTYLILLCTSFAALADENMIFRAMKDELDRSMQELKFDSFEKPYYISYRIVDSRHYQVSASLGALLSQEENLRRELIVDLRVGDYKLDSSNLFEFNFSRVPSLLRFDSKVNIPMDADYTEIRRLIWLATDSAYKSAVQKLAKKKALLSSVKDGARPDDFLYIKPEKMVDKPKTIDFDISEMVELISDLSAIGKSYNSIQLSELDWKYVNAYTRIIDSEGRKVARNDNATRIVFKAEAQAEDGESLFDEDVVFANTPDDLPSKRNLMKFVESRYEQLSKRQKAVKMDAYVGPVLFRPKAAAELIRQSFAAKAAAYRQPEKDPSIRIQGFTTNTLQGQLKQRILPRGFSIDDRPLEKEFDGEPLLGGFSVDDQGVKSQNKTLVKNGRLIELISSRSPIKDYQVTGGNHLDGSIAASNLILNVKRPLEEEELIEEMVTLIEEREAEYGIVVEKLDGEFQRLNRPNVTIFFGGNKGLNLEGLNAYRLYKDGRKEQVRQLKIPNFDIRSMKDIVAAGKDYSVYHAPSIAIGGNSFMNSSNSRKYDVSSFVAPSLLFEELSLTAQEDAQLSLPVRKWSEVAK